MFTNKVTWKCVFQKVRPAVLICAYFYGTLFVTNPTLTAILVYVGLVAVVLWYFKICQGKSNKE